MLKITWVGWVCQGNSDKLWGVVQTGTNSYYNFWCRRGQAMSFKKTSSPSYSHKKNKGYNEITTEKLEEIYPGFMEEAQNRLVYRVLADS